MELTLTQAAKRSGKSKSTIHRAIKNGKLSAQRQDDGSYRINHSELLRVFPEPVPDTANETIGNPIRNGVEALEMKVEMLEAQMVRDREIAEEQLSRERETVDDLRKRLDRAEDRVMALSAPREPEQRRGLWSRLFG